eukprot:TRINITY_DN74826_c0_g1_i1.p1 TRINITY_DN74826_c0_g1~~TRINITY_DN74826_c0_g1_i1.p1  ORF type:complete len:401 (+),score=98.46 TRINITY_DN74826_c0_g1_i1:127-1329(+)
MRFTVAFWILLALSLPEPSAALLSSAPRRRVPPLLDAEASRTDGRFGGVGPGEAGRRDGSGYLAALLQTEAAERPRRSKLPPMNDVLRRSRGVLEQMNSQMEALEAKISDARRDSANTVEAQKVKYEERLERMRKNNSELSSQNDALVRKIKGVRAGIEHGKVAARRLSEGNAALVKDLRNMASNLSLAKEFAANALREADAVLHSKPLNITHELQQQDADRQHQKGLEAVGKGQTPSLLQVANAQHRRKRRRRAGREDPQVLLSSLMGSLNDLTREQNASLAALGRKFEEGYRTLDAEHEVLSVKHQGLLDLLATETETKGKLDVAVKRLQESQAALMQRSNALRTFAKRLGASAQPGGAAPAPAAAAPAKKTSGKRRAERKQPLALLASRRETRAGRR